MLVRRFYSSCILDLPDINEEVHSDLLQIIVGEVQVKSGGGQAAGYNSVRLNDPLQS
jgi:hypothetical protein